MSTIEAPSTDIEAGGRPNGRHRRRRRRRRRTSIAGGSETTTDGSLCFSDSDDQSSRFSEIEGISVNPSRRGSTVSDSLSDEVDLESGEVVEVKVHSAKEERDCRICHLNLGSGAVNQETGVAIELGCSCKGDLGAAHKQCAETWFMIKGNRTCEICGATALNVVGDRTNEPNNASTTTAAAPAAAAMMLTEPQSFWHGRRVMNFLLGCMVFAFVISWLFHFHVLA